MGDLNDDLDDLPHLLNLDEQPDNPPPYADRQRNNRQRQNRERNLNGLRNAIRRSRNNNINTGTASQPNLFHFLTNTENYTLFSIEKTSRGCCHTKYEVKIGRFGVFILCTIIPFLISLIFNKVLLTDLIN